MHEYRPGLYGDQAKELAKVILDEDTKKRYLRSYQNYQFNLRKEFGLTGSFKNFSQQLLVDEITLTTIRIQEMERYLLQIAVENKHDEKIEELLGKAKDQRRKSLEMLRDFATGKNRKDHSESFRNRMARSRKYEAVRKIENTLDEQIRPEVEPEEPPLSEMEGLPA